MPRTTVSVGGRIVTISRDVPGGQGHRLDVLVRARLLDELNDRAVEARPAVRVTPGPVPRGLRGRAGPGGLVGLVGVPRRAVPTLDSDDYPLTFTVVVPGFLPRELGGTLGQQATFPATFQALDLGDTRLHRSAVVLSGRVTRRTTVGAQTVIAPVSNARVRLTGIWRTLPPATAATPATAPDIVAIDPPLYADRPVTTGRVRRVTATPVAGQDKRLLEDADPGALSIRLSDRVNLVAPPPPAAASVLELEEELMELAGIAGATSPGEPATATLAYPLAGRHPAGTLVRRRTIASPSTYRTLVSEAHEGDVCLLPQSLTGLTTPAWAQVNQGGRPHEYHRLLTFDVLSGTDGRWRLPPLSRVAQVSLSVESGPATVSRTLTPTYERGRDAVDVELP
jgi:hypothetical protein